MNNLEAQRATLIDELNRQIVKVQADPVCSQPLPARMAHLLNRIQRINERIDMDVETSVRGILDAQDAIADQIFGEGAIGPQLVAEINRVTESIEEFGQRLSIGAYYYAAA